MRASHDQAEVGKLIENLAGQITAAFSPSVPLNIVGIRTRGEILAQRLTRILQARGFKDIGRGVLDVTLYRDDLSEIGPRPLVLPTHIDIDINGKPMLLVDDVIYTGRSVRSALDALIDFGRPSVIRLVALVDRGGRELPIQPDFVGLKISDLSPAQRVSVHMQEQDGKDEILIQTRDSQ